MVYYDEGYIINSALRIIHGQIPYRDFDVAYTPLSFVTTSLFLNIFGVNLLAERLTALFISLLSLVALYKLLQHITTNKILIILSLLFFIAWGPAHINFAWPVMFALCFLFYALWFFLEGIKTQQKNYFYFSGIMTVLVFLAKQNFGVGLLWIFLLIFIFQKFDDKKRSLIYFFYGFTSLSLLTITVLLATHSFYPFLSNLYFYTFQRILVAKTLDTPFLYDGSLLVRTIKLLFYTLPFTSSFLATYYLLQANKRQLLIIPLSVLIFYLLGIRPTTDYNHFVPLLAMSVLSWIVIIIWAKQKMLKIIFFLLFFVLLILGFQTAYFKEYYKWDAALNQQNNLVTNPRFRILLNKPRTDESQALIAYIDKYTKPTDVIFVNYYAPLVYFLSDRQNATRYDLVSPNDTPDIFQQQMIEDLQNRHITLVVMSYLNEKENSPISNYVRKNFPFRKRIGGFIILTKDKH